MPSTAPEVGDFVVENDTVWIWFGAGCLVMPFREMHERMDFGTGVTNTDGEVIGWAAPALPFRPTVREGFKLEQVKRSGPQTQRALDHLIDTPFGRTWLYEVVPA